MLEEALKLLKEFKDNGYKAYIVGGYVRDHILGIESSDVDITTNATPKEVIELFYLVKTMEQLQLLRRELDLK